MSDPSVTNVLSRAHLPGLASCPFLPSVDEPIPAAAMKAHRHGERGADFYGQALRCAQSLWLQGFPAQSLLQINRAFGADLRGDEPALVDWPLPYRAAAWVMRRRESGQFIGNPRRHYQHLATRMVEPRRSQRAWRAWACWYLACRIFPEYPADEKQIAEEGIVEPTRESIVEGLMAFGVASEVPMWEAAIVLAGDPGT
jgi:hypothetical protein